jgi:hypothetical protein
LANTPWKKLAPEEVVGEHAVKEDERWSSALVQVANGALGKGEFLEGYERSGGSHRVLLIRSKKLNLNSYPILAKEMRHCQGRGDGAVLKAPMTRRGGGDARWDVSPDARSDR